MAALMEHIEEWNKKRGLRNNRTGENPDIPILEDIHARRIH